MWQGHRSEDDCRWKDILLYSQIPGGGQVTRGVVPASVKRQEVREKVGKNLYCGDLYGGMGEAGQAALGLASLNNFSLLWGIGYPTLGWLEQGVVDTAQMEVIKKVAGGVGPGMFALCMEGALTCQPIWKLASQLLSLEIGKPWERQPLQRVSKALTCKSIKYRN